MHARSLRAAAALHHLAQAARFRRCRRPRVGRSGLVTRSIHLIRRRWSFSPTRRASRLSPAAPGMEPARANGFRSSRRRASSKSALRRRAATELAAYDQQADARKLLDAETDAARAACAERLRTMEGEVEALRLERVSVEQQAQTIGREIEAMLCAANRNAMGCASDKASLYRERTRDLLSAGSSRKRRRPCVLRRAHRSTTHAVQKSGRF